MFVLSSWLFVRGNVSNLMTTVIPMMLTPQALELSPTFARVEWISCSRNSIGRVRKPNHPFPASAAGAVIAPAPPDEAAMAAASATASESRSASAIEERTCWRESTCWRRDDGSTMAAESLLVDFDDGASGRRGEDDAGGANAAAIGAEEAATINDRT